MSYYAVAKGRNPGVYRTWEDCKKEVLNFKSPKYKKFNTEEAALKFIKESNGQCDEQSSSVSLRPATAELYNMVCAKFEEIPLQPDSLVNAKSIQTAFAQNISTLKTQLFERLKCFDEDIKKMKSCENEVEENLCNNMFAKALVPLLSPTLRIIQLEKNLELLKCHFTSEISKLNEDLKKLLTNQIDQDCQYPSGSRHLNSAQSEEIKNAAVPLGKRKQNEFSVNTTKKKKLSTFASNSNVSNDVMETTVGKYKFLMSQDGFIEVYTDGACEKNGRSSAKAGYGCWFGDNHPLNISEPVVGRPTNNTAEIQAALQAIRAARNAGCTKVKVYTDSKFMIKCITEWIHKWKRNGWKLTDGSTVKNKLDLIELNEVMTGINVKYEYVPGHRGVHGNEMADMLAKAGARRYTEILLSEF